MLDKKLFFVGITLLVLSTSSTFVLIYTLNLSNHLPSNSLESIPFWYPSICNGNCGGGVDPIIGKSILEGLHIEYEWSKKVSTDSSDSISVFSVGPADSGISDQENALSGIPVKPGFGGVFPKSKDNRQIDVNTPFLWEAAHNCENTSNLKSLDPCTINGAFGSNYRAFASAHLVANAFNIQPMGPEEASVDQNSIEWDWNIEPKTAGIQAINLDIDILWKPVAKGEVILRQIWRKRVVIEVDQPFLASGQITFISLASTISALLTALAGVGITISSVYAGLRKILTAKDVKKEELTDEEKRVNVNAESNNTSADTPSNVPKKSTFIQ